MPNENPTTNPSNIKVKVDGTDLTADQAKASEIQAIRVDMVNDGPDYFEITLAQQGTGETVAQTDNFPSADKYKIGSAMEIGLGYQDDVPTLFKGQIARMDGIFEPGQAAKFVVAGFDRLHLLTRGRFTKHWQDVKYSDIASSVAGECGLSTDVDATDTTHKYVSMNNQTYFSFLTDLARRVNYELNVDDKKLMFKKVRTNNSSVATLTFGVNMKSGRIRVQTANQVTKVRVLAYDDAAKKQIIGEATAMTSTKLSSKTGPEVVNAAFGAAEYWITSYPAAIQSEVDTAAKSIFDEMAHRYVELDAECEGNPKLIPGAIVTIEKCTPHFDGDYYIVRAIHSFKVSKGGKGDDKAYQTRIICSRPGWNVS